MDRPNVTQWCSQATWKKQNTPLRFINLISTSSCVRGLWLQNLLDWSRDWQRDVVGIVLDWELSYCWMCLVFVPNRGVISVFGVGGRLYMSTLVRYPCCWLQQCIQLPIVIELGEHTIVLMTCWPRLGSCVVRQRNGVRPALGPPFSDCAEFGFRSRKTWKLPPTFFSREQLVAILFP